MNIEVGNESRFFDFIKGLNDKDKIVLISHTDLDGIAAAKVVNEVVDSDEVMFVNYGDINLDLVGKLKEGGFTKVIMTDLMIDNNKFVSGLEEFADVLILDHHPAFKDFNSDKTVFLKVEGDYCAAYFCYELFNKIQNLGKIDWLVGCACVSDFCHIKVENWLAKIYEKYGDKFEREGRYVRMDGNIWNLQWTLSLALIYFRDNLNKVFDSIGDNFRDIGDLEEYAKDVQGEIDESVEIFESGKEEFNGGFFWEFNPERGIGSIVSNIISNNYFDKTIIILRIDGDYCKLSARRPDKKIDVGKFLIKLVDGFEESNAGGHAVAAGGIFLKKDLEAFKKRLGVKS